MTFFQSPPLLVFLDRSQQSERSRMGKRSFLGQETHSQPYRQKTSPCRAVLFLMDAHIFRLTGRAQLPASATWSVFIPLGIHPFYLEISCLQKSCSSLCRQESATVTPEMQPSAFPSQTLVEACPETLLSSR